MKYDTLVVAVMMIASSPLAGQETNTSPLVQTNCPVMEGRPINKRLYVDYQGFRIYVCCLPCVKAVRKNPEKYLKKLLDQGITPEKAKPDAAPESGAEKAEKASQKQNNRKEPQCSNTDNMQEWIKD